MFSNDSQWIYIIFHRNDRGRVIEVGKEGKIRCYVTIV